MPQLDLRPGRVMLALGAAGLGGAAATGGAADADYVAAPAPAGGVAAPVGTPVALSAATTRRNLLVGRRVSVHGALHSVTAPGVVALQQHRSHGWVTVGRAQTRGSGRYGLGFRPARPGSIALRVRYTGARGGAPVVDALPVVNVYRLAGASWYGPGGSLACGGTLTSATLGVAHKTLPCGTMVRLHLGNRTVRVPVIDRGPYVSGREFDLTPATKHALGFGDVGLVWSTR